MLFILREAGRLFTVFLYLLFVSDNIEIGITGDSQYPGAAEYYDCGFYFSVAGYGPCLVEEEAV
jgi:hypothetical protein